MSPDPAKATHYVQQLDIARCEGSWDHVPELVRKIRKHAPEKACLALTAETEQSIALATQNLPPNTRPPTAVSAKDLEVSQQLPKLLEVIDQEKSYLEDRFQAQVCVGWLHWVVGEYSLASVRLPKSIDQEYSQFESLDNISEWTKVCALKSAYLKANCLARNGQLVEALGVFESSLPSLSNVWTTPSAKKQLRYWSELFLTEYCMISSQAVKHGDKTLDDPNCLSCFRSWAKYWEASRGASQAGGYGFRGSVPRRRIWYEYYATISTILQQDLPFPTGNLQPVANDSSARNHLRAELKKVEANYEALLLNETQFPRAEEERQEVEAFVALVMQNWNVLNGRAWRDVDLGQGGRESLSRGVLDILYRAATKTFHSTAILRHLFTVHLAVAEFDLALKAFDSYLDLVKKGKARVAKTSHPEPSLDDDATALRTISSCIAALCRYGDRDAAEKARDLASELDQWIQRLARQSMNGEDDISPLREDVQAGTPKHQLPPEVLALSWQSMGLAHAQWARVTYDSASRPEIRLKAVHCLRKSLSAEFGRSADLGGVFALGLLLAEQRELTTAIELVKTALMSNKPLDERQNLHGGPYWRERCLIPLWHLLSLLLSARQDYVMAARACEGAFEQFRDPSILFGTKQLNGTYRSDHLNEVEARNEKPAGDFGRGLVDDMEDFEREGILEVKMTQLAIVELLEGPKVAVNASLELLTLFSRLFGSVQNKPALNPPKSATAPKSSAGTIRSITGSIFGSRSERPGRTRQSMIGPERMASIPSRPQTTQTTASTLTAAPTIQVSHENGSIPEMRRTRKSASLTRKSDTRRRGSLRKRDSSGSRRRAVSSGGLPNEETLVDGEGYFTQPEESHDFFTFASKRFASSGAESFSVQSVGRTLSQADSYLSTRSRGPDLAGISVDGVETRSNILPVIQFSKDHDRRRRGAVLVRLWLMIAGFYRRANMFDDSKGAIAEAQKLVQSLEAEVAKDTSGSLSLKHAGWAGKKSIEELYGDVWAEMGCLSVAKEAPYNARSDFESALTHFPDHPLATVGLSNILLDIYSEKLLPPPAVPALNLVGGSIPALGGSGGLSSGELAERSKESAQSPLPSEPLGLGRGRSKPKATQGGVNGEKSKTTTLKEPQLLPPYKAESLPLIDRLAARERAYGLLTGLTKLGSGWNYSDAWFALARAYEESGQPDKAKEVLWWCVELEEGMGVRDWSCVGIGGYVL